jgi:hypothetical protein
MRTEKGRGKRQGKYNCINQYKAGIRDVFTVFLKFSAVGGKMKKLYGENSCFSGNEGPLKNRNRVLFERDCYGKEICFI